MSYHGCVAVIIHKLSPFDIPLLNMNVIECAKGVILIKNMGGREYVSTSRDALVMYMLLILIEMSSLVSRPFRVKIHSQKSKCDKNVQQT